MALTVENGTGLSNAESYISVADASTRLAGLGFTTWATMSTAEMEQALRRATAYMERAYRSRWAGTRILRDQALAWPRYGAYADGYCITSTIVPVDVANACAELAFKAASGDLQEDVVQRVIREKVGPLETEYSEYGDQSVGYRAIDAMLAPYMMGGGIARVIRA